MMFSWSQRHQAGLPASLGSRASGAGRSRVSDGHPLRLVGAVSAAAPMAWAGFQGARFALQAGAARRRDEQMYPDVPAPAPSAAFAASVAVDEMLMLLAPAYATTTPMSEYADSSRELDDAVRFYETNGWLQSPGTYFATPPPLHEVDVQDVKSRHGAAQQLSYESLWAPRPGEPGRERWLSLEKNRTAYATVLRHDDKPRPWLVCLHGQGMGRLSDIDNFRLRRLHHDLGLNLVLPLLPLHGRRRAGLKPQAQFVSGVYPVNNVLGFGQAVWEVRRLLTWLRQQQDATAIGLFGFSLGSYAASIAAEFESELACVIAVVPSDDVGAPLKANQPLLPTKRRAHQDLHDWRSGAVQSVVSPVAAPCLVPKHRRFILAGQGDRLGGPEGAAALWRHWDRPHIDWLPSGHVTFARAPGYEDRLREILVQSDLVARPTAVG